MRIDAGAGTRRRPISVTSLIDVIFLLLLFFMLSSTFTKFSEVEIVGGRAGARAPGVAPGILLRVNRDVWTINGMPVGAEGAVAELKRLEQAGAVSAVLLVRDDMTSQALVSAVERIRRETSLTLQVAR